MGRDTKMKSISSQLLGNINNLINLLIIVNLYRVAIDACDRLWFVDVGFTDFLTENGPSLGGTMYARPTLYIYDLKTDTLLRKYVFDQKIARQDSFFANIVSRYSYTQKNVYHRVIYILGFGCK